MLNHNETKNNQWDFSDWAFTITGIFVGIVLVVPELMYSYFDISILGGSFADITLDAGINTWSLNQLRSLSPLLFLLTTTIVYFKEAFDARKNGGYKGSLFTHTFESLFEDAIYMAITTIMVYSAVLIGAMSISWLAGPITWILFVFIFPFVKKSSDIDEVDTPWLLLFIFAMGIIAEAITGVWIAFPLSWLIICAIKCVDNIRGRNYSIDTIFNIIYYAFSVILIAVGIGLNFWIASWAAFPFAIVICWVLSKIRRYRLEK